MITQGTFFIVFYLTLFLKGLINPLYLHSESVIMKDIISMKGHEILENFIYSLNATIPVFVVMLAGWILRRLGMLNQNFVNTADRFNFRITLPALLFRDIAAMDIMRDFDMKFFFYCMIATALCFFMIWSFAEVLIKEKGAIGSFVQGSFRGSMAVLGIALIQNIYGNAGLAPLMIVAAVPLYNIFSVWILTVRGDGDDSGEKVPVKATLMEIATNPFLISIFAGLPFSLMHIELPGIISKSLNSFAAMATPLALIAIGAGFELHKAIGRINMTMAASIIKLILQPAIFLPVGILLGFRDQAIVALLIMLGAPSTPACYIMAKNMGNDSVLASGIVVSTMLLSPVTITLWFFILKSMAYI